VSGVVAYPSSSLAGRAAAYLAAGPASSAALVRDVLGLRGTRPGLAERIARTLVQDDPRVTALPDGRWTRAERPDGPLSAALDGCRFAVVDVETTGMRARGGDRIVEVAVVAIDGGETRVAFHSLVNPGVRLSPFVTRLTGITDAQVTGAPRFQEIADAVLASLAGAVFVAHNARFDWGFVAAELDRARGLALGGPRLCTVRLARRLLPPFGSRNLDNVARYLGVAIDGRHRATGDAMATARILSLLLAVARDRGARTIADLLRPPVRRSASPSHRPSV
jgi:DNA polymerase-3 subunit epsilon